MKLRPKHVGGGLLALIATLVLTRSLLQLGYSSRGLWRDTAQTTVPQSTQAEVLARMRRVLHARRHSTPTVSSPPPSSPCLSMRLLHGVVPHVTWGTLPEAEQAQWAAHGCDQELERHSSDASSVSASASSASASSVSSASSASASASASASPPPSPPAPALVQNSSRGVPLWLEPPQTNLLFNTHAQAQLALYEPSRTTLHFTFGSAVMMDFVKNWLHFAKEAGLTPYLVGTADAPLQKFCAAEGVAGAAIDPRLDVWTYHRKVAAEGELFEMKTQWQYFRHHNSDFLGMGLVKVRRK